MPMVQVSKMPKGSSRSDHHDRTAYSARLIDRVPFPCFQPNRPDPNVLTEVDHSSDFPALESARKAAYIVKLWPADRKCSTTASSHPARANDRLYIGNRATENFGLQSLSGKYGAESEICKRFRQNGRKPGKVACSLTHFIISVSFFR